MSSYRAKAARPAETTNKKGVHPPPPIICPILIRRIFLSRITRGPGDRCLCRLSTRPQLGFMLQLFSAAISDFTPRGNEISIIYLGSVPTYLLCVWTENDCTGAS